MLNVIKEIRIQINPSLVWWDTPGYYSNHGEILEHPGS